MAQFPRREAEIAALARSVIGGLRDDPELLQGCPVSVSELQAALTEYRKTRNAAVEAAGHAVLCTTVKNTALDALAQLVKRVLRFAESVAGVSHGRLIKLGWGVPRERVQLEEPSQPLDFRILKEGENSITLAWRKPPEGGRVAAYRVERQRMGADEWIVVGTAVKKRITVEHQEEGVAWYYRVIAINKAGEGMPSNSVKAVL